MRKFVFWENIIEETLKNNVVKVKMLGFMSTSEFLMMISWLTMTCTRRKLLSRLLIMGINIKNNQDNLDQVITMSSLASLYSDINTVVSVLILLFYVLWTQAELCLEKWWQWPSRWYLINEQWRLWRRDEPTCHQYYWWGGKRRSKSRIRYQ